MEITIKTKFDIGQTVITFNALQNKLRNIEIVEVQYDMDANGHHIWYRDKKTLGLFREQVLFTSREEFIAQL